jgi:hypothetical protein
MTARRRRARAHRLLLGQKIIFIDIDGVLNGDQTPNPRAFPYIVDVRLLKRLKTVLRRTRAKVVLSSTWRIDPAGRFAARYYGVPFVACCPDQPKRPRRDEILEWLAKHPRVKRYAVIDDEDDELDGLPLFQPTGGKGLTAAVARGVERYLKGETDRDMRAGALVRLAQNVEALFKRGKS